MKIAVTGHNGFLGKHLIADLKKEGFRLSLFNKKKHDLFAPYTLKSFLENAGVVIHLAGANRDSDFNLVRVNTLGTAGLIEGMGKFSPNAKIIFASSFQVYNQSNTYALSKRFAEEIIEYFSNRTDVKSIVFRISNIYGPGCRPYYNSVIATFIDKIKKGQELVINGDGNQKRDYIYVDDVVSAIIKAVSYKSQNRCKYFDICSGKLTSINQIVEKLKKAVSYKLKVKYNKSVKESGNEILKNFTEAGKSFNWHPEMSIERGLVRSLHKNGIKD